MMAAFSDVFADVTKQGTKLQTSEYLASGKYPIIDQGQDDIAGYTDREDGLFTDVPAIIFGDHTRIVKYVDTPFFLGADGVKVLKATIPDVDYRYLYYAVSAVKIPNTGYNRHFKWLKEAQISLPDLSTQRRIADTLDKVSEGIGLCGRMMDELDLMVKSRFSALFYSQKYPILKWNEVFSTTTGKLDSNAAVVNGKYPFFTCSKEILRIDKYAFEQEALLLAGNNASGKYDVKYYNGRFNAYQRTYVLTLKEKWSYRLFQCQLEEKLEYLQQKSLGGLTKYLTLKILGELSFIIPPKEKQNEFEIFISKINKSKLTIQGIRDKMEMEKLALMQEYFGRGV